jgi:hypothetical protein
MTTPSTPIPTLESYVETVIAETPDFSLQADKLIGVARRTAKAVVGRFLQDAGKMS